MYGFNLLFPQYDDLPQNLRIVRDDQGVIHVQAKNGMGGTFENDASWTDIATYNVYTGQTTILGTTLNDGNNNMVVGGTLAVDIPASTLNGTTAGTVTWVEDQVGTVKRFFAVVAGYENTTTTAQSITFPVPFTKAAAVVANTTGMTLTVTNNSVTFPASMTAAASGVIEILGI